MSVFREIGPFKNYDEARSEAAVESAATENVVSVLFRDANTKSVGEKLGEVYVMIISKE